MNARNMIVPALAAGFLSMSVLSNAQLTLRISNNGGATFTTVTDGGLGDNDPAANSIQVIDTFLISNFASLAAGSNISASSNLATAQTFRRLSESFDLFGAANFAGSTNFLVQTSQDGFVIPSGNPKTFDSTASFSFNANSGSTSTFQGATDTVLFGATQTDNVLSYTSVNATPNSGSGNGNGYSFSNTPYSQTIFSGTTVVANGESQLQGNTTVNSVAVPEPGTVAMLVGMGVSGSAFLLRRRRAVK